MNAFYYTWRKQAIVGAGNQVTTQHFPSPYPRRLLPCEHTPDGSQEAAVPASSREDASTRRVWGNQDATFVPSSVRSTRSVNSRGKEDAMEAKVLKVSKAKPQLPYVVNTATLWEEAAHPLTIPDNYEGSPKCVCRPSVLGSSACLTTVLNSVTGFKEQAVTSYNCVTYFTDKLGDYRVPRGSKNISLGPTG